MSDFISDKEMQKLESSESPDFIPDENPWMPEQSFTPTSRTESALRGGAQGLTSDFADEIAARIRSQMEDRSYDEVLPEERTKFKQAQASHPGYYGAAQVGGAVAPWLIPGGGAAGAAVRGSKWVAPIAAGALQGYGASEAETVGGALPDAAIGGIFGLGGAAVGNVIGATPGAVRNFASNRAAAHLGAERGTIKSLGADRVQQAGATALKEGILSTDTPLMQKRAGALSKSSGSRIGEINQMIDETGERYFSPQSAAGEFRKESGGFYESPLNRDIKNQYDNIIEAISGLGEDNIGILKAQELKEQLGRAAKFDKPMRDDKAMMAGEAYHVVKKHLDAAVTKGEQALGKTDVLADLYKQRKLYGDTKVMEKLLANRYAREQGNKMGTGLTNTIVGSQAAQVAASGNPLAAASMYGGKIGYERYGNIAMAHGADKIAKVLEYMPNKFGKYAPLMSQAIRQGPKAFAIQHFLMASRDPEYTKRVEQAVLEAEKEDEKKKSIAPIEPPSLGQQLGSAIDNFSWSDSIGLDPQERDEAGLYAEQVPQPASIKPFSFKKLFPSKSAVGSEIKQLPTMRRNFDDSLPKTYKEIQEGVFGEGLRKTRLQPGELTTSERVMDRKLSNRDKSEYYGGSLTNKTDHRLNYDGAQFSDREGKPMFAYGRTPQANKHEHIHQQIEGLNRIDPKASAAMDEYLRLKARSYDIPIAVITTKMHGPEEFMTVIGDILEDPNVRHDYLGKFKDKDEIVQKLRKFYTDSATEVQNMEKEDILRLVDEHRARWKSPGDFVKNRRELGDFR
jgi:hypothetical protein